MRIGAVMEWLTKRLAPAAWQERKAADAEERRLNRETVERANRVVDTWNERTRANWRADSSHA